MGAPTLEAIIEERKTILGDILSLLAEGTNEQKATAVDALARQEDSKYRAMMEEVERQCDKYVPKVGEAYLKEYGLTAKDPTQIRRYFVVLNYIRPIAEGNELSKSMAAKKIAIMEPMEYAAAIQVLRSANEHPSGGDQAKELLREVGGLGFIQIQHQAPQGGRYGKDKEVYDPAAAREAQTRKEEAFRLLHYNGK